MLYPYPYHCHDCHCHDKQDGANHGDCNHCGDTGHFVLITASALSLEWFDRSRVPLSHFASNSWAARAPSAPRDGVSRTKGRT